MPVRLLSSPILRWPDRETVHRAISAWARRVFRTNPEVLRIGYFGSFAREDWGVGSDLDLIAIVRNMDEPFEKRNLSWDTTFLPVPVDFVIYTEKEWKDLEKAGTGFYKIVNNEVKWIVIRDPKGVF